jgi:hypothetical protein
MAAMGASQLNASSRTRVRSRSHGIQVFLQLHGVRCIAGKIREAKIALAITKPSIAMQVSPLSRSIRRARRRECHFASEAEDLSAL